MIAPTLCKRMETAAAGAAKSAAAQAAVEAAEATKAAGAALGSYIYRSVVRDR